MTAPAEQQRRHLSPVEGLPRPTRHRHPFAALSRAIRGAARFLAGPALAWTVALVYRAWSLVLQIAGLASATWAAYRLHPTAGYATAALALFTLEYLTRTDE